MQIYYFWLYIQKFNCIYDASIYVKRAKNIHPLTNTFAYIGLKYLWKDSQGNGNTVCF